MSILSLVLLCGCPCQPTGVPSAAFTADIRYGKIPLTVQFTDTSVPGDSPITAWAWRFGDDETSTEQNPIHIYKKAGNYDVSLTATNAQGNDTVTQTAYIVAGNVWARRFGGALNDTAQGMCRTKDGDCIIVGSTENAEDGTLDAYVVKVNSLGERVWARTFGGPDNDIAYAVLEADNGDLLVAGSTRSYGAGAEDMYLLRLDDSGVELWHKAYGLTSLEAAYDIVAAGTEEYLLVGETRSYGPDYTDVYMVKVDDEGKTLSGWPKHVAGPGRNIARAACKTKDGGFAMAGYTGTATSGVNNDVYALKIDAAGTVQWEKTYGGSGDDRGYDLVENSSGSLFICGFYTTTTINGIDMLLAELDDEGNVTRGTTFGGARREKGAAIIPVTSGYLLLGAVDSSSTNDDFFLVKASAEGNTYWSRTFGGAEDDNPIGLAEGGGGFLLAGSTRSYTAGESDFYLVKTNADGYGPSEAPVTALAEGETTEGEVTEGEAAEGEGEGDAVEAEATEGTIEGES